MLEQLRLKSMRRQGSLDKIIVGVFIVTILNEPGFFQVQKIGGKNAGKEGFRVFWRG